MIRFPRPPRSPPATHIGRILVSKTPERSAREPKDAPVLHAQGWWIEVLSCSPADVERSQAASSAGTTQRIFNVLRVCLKPDMFTSTWC